MLHMNRFIVLVLIISSIACAENGFWKEFDCPNKKMLRKNIIDTSSFEPKTSGKCKMEKAYLKLTGEGACIISYGSKEEYFSVERCGKDFCLKK